MSVYSTSGSLSRHRKTIHLDIKPESCPHCSARFRDKYTLGKHLPMHDPENEAKRKSKALDWEGAEIALSQVGNNTDVKTETQVQAEENDMEIEGDGEELQYAVADQEASESPLPKPMPRPARTPTQRFECYICEERFDLFEFYMHVKGHCDDLRTTSDQVGSVVQSYGEVTEKMTATISSWISKEGNG